MPMSAFRTVTVATVLAITAVGAHAQGPVIQPGETLVIDGVPPIPVTLRSEVARYTEARNARFVDWHPTRRELMVATRFANVPQLHVVRMPGGARRQITFEAEPVTRAAYQPKTGESIIFQKDSGGGEFYQLYRLDLVDGRTTLLTDGTSRHETFIWSRGGDRVAYTSTRRNGTDADIYILDPSNPATGRKVVDVAGGGWYPLDWSPDDGALLVQEYSSIAKSRLWLVDIAAGTKTPLTPDEEVAYGFAVFSGDGRSIFATNDKGEEFLQIVQIDRASGAMSPIETGINWSIEEIALSPDGRSLAFTTNEAGLSMLHVLDTGTRGVRPVTGLPDGVAAGLKWHSGGRELAVSLTAGGAPAEAYSVELRTGRVDRWTESELGGITPSSLSAPSLIRWTSFDHREITGFLYQPPARFTGKRPVIINIHGGPEAQFRPAFMGRANYYLQELGIALLLPNVRGSDGYGKTFVGLDNGLKREDSVKDIGALLDWIAGQPQLDASRVLVVGGSYGGYMTLAAAVHYPDRIRAAVDVVGISNFNTFLKNTESYRRDLRRAEYGDERLPEMAAFFERIAPLNHASKIKAPLFVIQGGNDPRVPKTESEQMVSKLKAQGTPVWYLMAKDEGHGFAKKSNQDFEFYSTVMFIRKYLLGPE
jgi:dipeptidyl aminopeptidase/acylaminoacyl peptidase